MTLQFFLIGAALASITIHTGFSGNTIELPIEAPQDIQAIKLQVEPMQNMHSSCFALLLGDNILPDNFICNPPLELRLILTPPPLKISFLEPNMTLDFGSITIENTVGDLLHSFSQFLLSHNVPHPDGSWMHNAKEWEDQNHRIPDESALKTLNLHDRFFIVFSGEPEDTIQFENQEIEDTYSRLLLPIGEEEEINGREVHIP